MYEEDVFYLRRQVSASFLLVAQCYAQHFAQIVVAVDDLTAGERVQSEHYVDEYGGRAPGPLSDAGLVVVVVDVTAAAAAGLHQDRVPDEPHVIYLQLELAVAHVHLDGEQAGHDVVREIGQLLRLNRRLVHRRVFVERQLLVDDGRLDGFAETGKRIAKQQLVALAVALHQINAHRVRFRVGRPERRGLFGVHHGRRSAKPNESRNKTAQKFVPAAKLF